VTRWPTSCALACAALLALIGPGCRDAATRHGQKLLSAYGCAGCHEIPGVVGRQDTIASSLEGWRWRRYVAGRALNTPESLVRWIQDPRSIDPDTAMPDLGVGPREAQRMAAYLWSLE
jgi:cytochrome c2